MAKTSLIPLTVNGSEIPVSSRDTWIVHSVSEDTLDTTYKVSALSYHSKTQLNAALFRSGCQAVQTTVFREELRAAIPHIAEGEEATLAINLLDEAIAAAESNTQQEWTEDESALIRRFERQARKDCPDYASMFADMYAWNRMYNWEMVRRAVVGIESKILTIELDHSGMLTDACMESIPDEDIAEIAAAAGRRVTLDSDAVKNSD